MVFISLISHQNSASFSQKLQKRQTSSECPSNEWKYFEGMCFAFIPETVTYDEAKQKCESKSENSFLATLRSDKDFEFIEDALKPGGETKWIGLLKIGEKWRDGPLIWADGSPASYTPWGSPDPTDNGRENCVALIQTGKIWDEDCNRKYASFCSFNPQPIQTTTPGSDGTLDGSDVSVDGGSGTLAESSSSSVGIIVAIAVVLILIVIGFFSYKKFSAPDGNAYGNYGNYGDQYSNYGPPSVSDTSVNNPLQNE